MLPLLVLAACHTCDPIALTAPLDAHTDVDVVYEVPLAALGLDGVDPAAISVSGDSGLDVGISGDSLYAIPASGFSGRAAITVHVTDKCNDDEVTFDLGVGDMSAACDTIVKYPAGQGATSVAIAGTFNDWTPVPMVQEDGAWTAHLPLSAGTYAYKFVVDNANWTCDPDDAEFQCDAGYDPNTWNVCSPGVAGCNSLLVVDACATPHLTLTDLAVDDAAGTADLTLTWAGSAAIATVSATLDDVSIGDLDGWTGDAPRSIHLVGLDATRHTVRITARDAAGNDAAPVYVPFWMDGGTWDQGVLYYAFVDRFANGDPGNDGLEGTSSATTDYEGGDWQGVIDHLDDLADLGVTAIWLTAPLDNPSGSWGSKCGATFSGYHGYWPSDPTALEEHFGDEALLHQLVTEAHARNLRVLVDWVGNHVHEDHPYYLDHPDWFNPRSLCVDADNWNTIPETCWFDPFLPDVNYYELAPLEQQVNDAIDLAIRYDIDGYRVDAVKHMARPVYSNLQDRIRREIEHRDAGGTDDFYTVGETFDGDRGKIASYTGPAMLDGQFDFPQYFTIRSAFIDYSVPLTDLEASFQASQGAFAGRTMSTFLGNHDVSRFVTVANEGDRGVCADDTHLNPPAQPPDSDLPYEKLKLAWTWLLTNEGLPLIYYGDEIGLPGNNDPDNRQVMRFGADLSAREASVRAHVRALARARRDHPALSRGERHAWWQEADVFAWSRVSGGDAMVAAVNRSDVDRTLTNGLAWAGLPTGGVWRDVITGQTVDANGDSLTFVVPARGSVVWVRE